MLNLRKLYFYFIPALVLVVFILTTTQAAEITPISVNAKGKPVNHQSDPNFEQDPYGTISADGRYVVFGSWRNDLVPGDTNKTTDIFVFDRVTNKNTRVSVASNGAQGDSSSFFATISADGRFVAFESIAKNLVAGIDLPKSFNALGYVHDRLTRRTTLLASLDSNGRHTVYSYAPSISADGRFLASESYPDIYVRDLLSKSTRLITDSKISPPYFESVSFKIQAISSDGRFIGFLKDKYFAYTHRYESYVYDCQSKKTTPINLALPPPATYFIHSMSADGRFVAITVDPYFSFSSENGPRPTKTAVFLLDLWTKKSIRIGAVSNPSEGGMFSADPTISADGRFVSYKTVHYDVYDKDFYAEGHVSENLYVYDGASKTNKLIAKVTGSNNYIRASTISGDGRYIGYNTFSYSPNINSPNMFVYDRLLDKAHHADLKLALASQPKQPAPNQFGTYIFTLVNYGPDTADNISLSHFVSNGKVLLMQPTQGICKAYAATRLCQLNKLKSGQALFLVVIAKFGDAPLNQHLTVNAPPVDAKPADNYLTVMTETKP